MLVMIIIPLQGGGVMLVMIYLYKEVEWCLS